MKREIINLSSPFEFEGNIYHHKWQVTNNGVMQGFFKFCLGKKTLNIKHFRNNQEEGVSIEFNYNLDSPQIK